MQSNQQKQPKLIDFRAKVFSAANVLFGQKFGTRAECFREAWKRVKLSVVLLQKSKFLKTFAACFLYAEETRKLKSELSKATKNGNFVAFSYIAGRGTKKERIRPAEGQLIDSTNYESKNSSRKTPSDNFAYFDKERNAVRSFKIENLIF